MMSRRRSAIVAFCTLVPVALAAASPPRAPSSRASIAAVAFAGIIRGKVVVASTKAPVANAQVAIGTRGAVTNDAGTFSIANVPAGTYTLQVRMIGYAPYSRPITVTDGRTTNVAVELTSQVTTLDQIVVTGTPSEARRREIGNSISAIAVSSLPEVSTSVDALLQGKTSGLTVTANTGQVGGGASIRLRGNVSATQNNQPLMYVDGVRIKSTGFPKNSLPTGYQGNSDNTVYSPLNDIDPADIERIEVIKGPAATTLYGTEAAAGVIQIFTKRGQTGNSRWIFQTDQSLSQTPAFGPTKGYEGNDLVVPAGEVDPWGTVPYMYLDPWLGTGHKGKYTLSLDGGRDEVKYFLSGSLSKEKGVLPLDKSDIGSVRANLTVAPRKDITVQWNSSFSSNAMQKTPTGGTAAGLTLNASRRDHNYFGSADPAKIGQVLAFQLTSQVDHLVTGGTLAYQPSENLSSRFILGYDLAMQETRNYQPYGFVTVPKGQISDGRYSSRTLTADYAATYSHDLIGSLHTSFSAGAQAVTVDQVNVTAGSHDFASPGEQTVSNGAVLLGFEDRIRVINAGFFFQDVLALSNRYFLTLGVRFDGNSAFGQSLGLQSYPKISGSYVVSDEAFWPKTLGTLKLRGAYGQSGRAPGAFDAVRTWQTYSWGGTSAFIPRNLGNASLGPERTAELEGGFESGLFGGRLNLDVTYYNRRTTNALFAVSQSPSNGNWAGQLQNVGELSSNGIEFGVNATLVQSQHFGWDAGMTYNTNHSKVVSLGGAAPFTLENYGWIKEGGAVPELRGYCVANPDAIADPIRQADCDYGPNTPTRTITGTSNFTLPADFGLSVRGEYQGGFFGYSLLDGEGIVRGIRWPSCFNVYPLIDAGQTSLLTARERAMCISTFAIRDYAIFPLDFFRLRDVTLRRTFSVNVGGASSAMVSLSAQNLYWWKKAKDSMLDAETSGGFTTSGMTERVRSVGGGIPLPRTFLMSVRLTY